MQHYSFIHFLYLIAAIILDVIANVFVKLSQGFKYKYFVLFAIIFVLAAFTALSFAIKAIPLAVAYGIWGGIGLIATAILGAYIFDERISVLGWIGMLLIICGVFILKFPDALFNL